MKILVCWKFLEIFWKFLLRQNGEVYLQKYLAIKGKLSITNSLKQSDLVIKFSDLYVHKIFVKSCVSSNALVHACHEFRGADLCIIFAGK